MNVRDFLFFFERYQIDRVLNNRLLTTSLWVNKMITSETSWKSVSKLIDLQGGSRMGEDFRGNGVTLPSYSSIYNVLRVYKYTCFFIYVCYATR